MGNLGQIRFEEPRTTFLSGDSGKWHDHPTSRTDHETEDLRVRIMFGLWRRQQTAFSATFAAAE